VRAPADGPARELTGAGAGTGRRGLVVLLTGAPGTGKTEVCRRVVDGARSRGLRVAGLLSESRRLASGRMMQTVLNLRTGERRRLAELVGATRGDPIGRGSAGRFSWRFVSDSMRWGRHELSRCATADVDLLVVDQVGPLELVAGSGWENAVDAVTSARFDLALIVVNPLVLEQCRDRIGESVTVALADHEEVRELLPEYLAVRAGWSAASGPPLLCRDGPELLAADLDGTLLDADGDPLATCLPSRLRGLVADGASVCLCTGRPTGYAFAAAERLGVERGYVIAYGGAETRELPGGRALESTTLPRALLRGAVDAARDNGLAVTVHGDAEDPFRVVLTGAGPDVDAALAALGGTADGRMTGLRPQAEALAVQAAEATKAKAVARLAARLGLAADAVVYLGDASDDGPALEWAGLGIAVGGDADAAAVADLVVSPADVGTVLTRLALARGLRRQD